MLLHVRARADLLKIPAAGYTYSGPSDALGRASAKPADAETASSFGRAFAKVGKKLFTLLDLCVSSLRRGHANLLCIVPILTDDPRRESKM